MRARPPVPGRAENRHGDSLLIRRGYRSGGDSNRPRAPSHSDSLSRLSLLRKARSGHEKDLDSDRPGGGIAAVAFGGSHNLDRKVSGAWRSSKRRRPRRPRSAIAWLETDFLTRSWSARCGALSRCRPGGLRERPVWRPRTKFENRGLRLGRGVREGVFLRPAT